MFAMLEQKVNDLVVSVNGRQAETCVFLLLLSIDNCKNKNIQFTNYLSTYSCVTICLSMQMTQASKDTIVIKMNR